MRKHILILTVILFASPIFAKDIPAVLPHPDDTPPAKDKPVKVYIMSGQSNMVGFGRIQGGSPAYPSIYLSADPTILPCKMPVGSSALLPHGVFLDKDGKQTGALASIYAGDYDATKDYSKETPVKQIPVKLGAVSEKLPSIDGPHTVIVTTHIEVPITGLHEVHAGFGDSENAIVSLKDEEIYRKGPDGEPVIKKIRLEKGKLYPLHITYLNGGSLAFWMELVDLKGKGTLETLVKEEGLFPFLIDDKGNWTVRNDVVLCESYLDKNKFKGGRNTPLTATANGKHIGPELGFGYVMGTFHDEPVLLIKADIGNRSLGWDYLPPGSERFEAEETNRKTGEKKTYIFAGYKDSQSKWEKGTEPKPGGWYAGKQYDECTQAIHGVLDNFDTLFPQYKDQGYEVAGFVWWQGHKDQNPIHASSYEQNLVNLIKAWRKEFKTPDAKWVIATIAFEGWQLGEPGKTIAEAQLAVDGDSGKYPEFKGNVKTVEARPFWRSMAESPTGTGYHYNHNAETYMLVGDALGKAMAELYGAKTEPSPTTPRPEPLPDKPVAEMTLDEKARLVYTDAFISPWGKDDREPTPEQFAAMGKALQPMIIGSIIPAYVAEAPGVPAYRRKGMSLMPIVTGKPFSKEQGRGAGLTSQLDRIIGYYNAAGIQEYDWKRFGPDMQNSEWYYYSFDPPEKQDAAKGDRNRKITIPEGMDNWFAADFDPVAAGWRKGKAPFGQVDGKLAAPRANCRDEQCGCSVVPKTLWEKEVLLIRQTFEIPELKEGHRYRLILGGSAHPFSGEGYSLYVNGKLFSESKGGNYKKGGARGGYILNDFLPDFKSGKVTIAVKVFLRYTGYKDKVAPPQGHISVWLEEAKLPKAVLKLRKCQK